MKINLTKLKFVYSRALSHLSKIKGGGSWVLEKIKILWGKFVCYVRYDYGSLLVKTQSGGAGLRKYVFI